MNATIVKTGESIGRKYIPFVFHVHLFSLRPLAFWKLMVYAYKYIIEFSFFKKKDFIYLFMKDTERGRDNRQREK